MAGSHCTEQSLVKNDGSHWHEAPPSTHCPCPEQVVAGSHSFWQKGGKKCWSQVHAPEAVQVPVHVHHNTQNTHKQEKETMKRVGALLLSPFPLMGPEKERAKQGPWPLQVSSAEQKVWHWGPK